MTRTSRIVFYSLNGIITRIFFCCTAFVKKRGKVGSFKISATFAAKLKNLKTQTMKKFLAIVAIAAFMTSCNDSGSTKTDSTSDSTMTKDSTTNAMSSDTAKVNTMADTSSKMATDASKMADTANKMMDKAADKMDKAADKMKKGADKMKAGADKMMKDTKK